MSERRVAVHAPPLRPGDDPGPRGVVFDIQHYAVHDGPGIRTLVFLKGCPLRCAWCCNPESQTPRPQLRHLTARCQACGTCAGACPSGAVTVGLEGTSFAWEICDHCVERTCVTACPNAALAVAGGEVSAHEVVARVARDMAFYRNSGGGVTFSGGEPLAQPEFLVAALGGCRALGIHTAVETCGHAATEVVRAVAPHVDLFLFDLKLAAPDAHRALTGMGNQLILQNLRWLTAAPGRVAIRFPVVPGATDGEDNVAAVASVARSLRIERVELEPYHALGTGKYSEIGLPSPAPLQPPTAEALARVAAVFARAGLHCDLA